MEGSKAQRGLSDRANSTDERNESLQLMKSMGGRNKSVRELKELESK